MCINVQTKLGFFKAFTNLSLKIISEISSTLKNAITTSIDPIKKTAQKQDLIKYKLNLCNKSESHKYGLSEFFNEIKSEIQKAKK